MSNPLATECPCGHGAFLHRSQEQIDINTDLGKRYVGECTGKNLTNGWCCQCQVDRATVIKAALTTSESETPDA